MTVMLATKPLKDLAVDVLIIPTFADLAPDQITGWESAIIETIQLVNAEGDFKGDLGETAVFYPRQSDKSPVAAKRVILSGMGTQAKWSYEKMRQAVAYGVRLAKKQGLASAAIVLPEGVYPVTLKDLAAIVVMAGHSFAPYKQSAKEKGKTLENVGLVISGGAISQEMDDAVAHGVAIGQAVTFVRDLANHPANMMTPTHLARDAKELADKTTTVRVLGRAEIEKEGMGALLAVAAGSNEEPKLIVLEYTPQDMPDAPLIGLVGKGITFDSGGISIKPAGGMEEMKLDMAGAATCLGVVAAAKALSLPVRLAVVLPCAENLPSGAALKPGDVITSMNGKSIEVINTDAEGRLVLADGISYLLKYYKPIQVIDIATLTGAALIALGHEAAALLGNNGELATQLKEAATRTGERVWELPMWDEYADMLKSDIADIKNMGDARKAGVITGAAFVGSFVPTEVPWAHLDVAGTAMMDKPRAYYPKDGSGWGVRLLVDYLEHLQ